MKQFKLLMLTAMITLCGAFLFTSCGDDDEVEEFKMPIGQWIYEGKGLLSDDFDAALIDIPQETIVNLLGRSVNDGKWYDYPLGSTYNIKAETATSGTITFSDKTKNTIAFKLAGNTLTLTSDKGKFVFKRTSGIKSEGVYQ